MPRLGPESLPAKISKFVRDGNVIVYDDINYPHAEIAKEAKIGEPMGLFILGLEFRRVDDAGAVEVLSGTLCFFSTSTSCELRGDPAPARDQTVEVAIALTGNPAKAG